MWADDGVPYASELSGVLNVVQMKVFNFLGTWLALQLNRWENYRTQSAFINAYVIKVFFFVFFNSFYQFLYIAFIKGHSRQGCLAGNCLAELQHQLLVVFVTMAFTNIVEVGLPYLSRWRRRRKNPVTPIERTMPLSDLLERTLQKEEYGSLDVDGTFDDYTEIVVQFGFVMLFTVAFPLAPLGGLVLNALEMKTDGLKLFKMVRRPFPEDTEDIGTWLLILHVLTVVSVLTNAGLLVTTFRCTEALPLLTDKRWTSDLLYFIAFSVLLLCLKAAITILVADRSASLTIAQQRLSHIKNRVCSVDVRVTTAREHTPLDRLCLQVQAPETEMCHCEDYGKRAGQH